MIRLIQRRLIIPRGDTGSFSIPVLRDSTDNIAVFTIFDEVTQTKIFQKKVKSEGGIINIAFTHADTVNLKPGEYVWDIKYYSNPEYIDDELVNGEEIDSYYAGFSLPVCEIRETADNYLVSPEAPTATLSPQQLDIVTNAIHSLNEAIRKTQENVEHYPEIRDEVWYAWDANLGDYVSTGVSANGIVGNGIASAVLNNDYTLTLNFTDGTSFTSPSIRGETGNGIDDIVLNNDFTLTISYTDGESYTTPSIRGPIGPTPQFSIGTVQDGAVAAASITGTAENPVLNLTLPNANVPTRVSELENDSGYLTEHQDLSDYVQKTDYATSSIAGLVKIGNGLYAGVNGNITTYQASSSEIKSGTGSYNPITPRKIDVATFYGLAKAAGDTTQSQSSNAVGAYTDEAKAAIQTMLDVPSNEEMNTAIGTAIGNINSFDMAVVQTLPTQDINTHTIYLVPKTGETNDVYDEYVYIDNNWEMIGNTQIDLSNYVQKTDYATMNQAGIIKVLDANGITTYDNTLLISAATNNMIKAGQDRYHPIGPYRVHTATFYGLAKAAGDSTQSASENAVGTYTDEAKAAIQQMLDVPSTGDIPDTSIYATKSDTVLDTTLSKGRKEGTTIGAGSFAFGTKVEASGANSFAIGNHTIASSHYAYAEGSYNQAIGMYSHAEGGHMALSGANIARGLASHAEGGMTVAAGQNSHTEGTGTKALGHSSHAGGRFNVEDNYSTWPEWVENTTYAVGDKVKVTNTVDNETTVTGYICQIANNDAEFDATKWTEDLNYNYVEIIGNGTADNARSNAYALDWNGTGHYMGDVYVHANADSSGGTKLATIEDIPEVPVTDVQVDGVSVLSNGVANVPVASGNDSGVVKIDSSYGIAISPSGYLNTSAPSESQIKAANKTAGTYRPIVPNVQHISTFYGLAKAAGDTTQSQSDNAVGNYTDAAKTAIKNMIGVEEGLKVVRLI